MFSNSSGTYRQPELLTDWLAGVMLAGRQAAVIGSLACSADWLTAEGTQQQQLKNYNPRTREHSSYSYGETVNKKKNQTASRLIFSTRTGEAHVFHVAGMIETFNSMKSSIRY